MKLKIGLVQHAISLNPDFTWGRIEEIILKDFESEDLLVLPELSLRPYPREEGADFVNTLDDEYIKRFKTLAKHLKTNIMAGFHLEKNGERFNELILFSDQGEIALSYSKQKLFKIWEEEKFIKAGTITQKTCINDFEIVPLICYDLRFPELFRKACGAELFVVQANWPVERIEHWKCLLQARAIENQAYVIGVNRVGETNGINFGGNSMIIDPLGKILVQMGDEEGFTGDDLDLQFLRDYRKSFPVF
jgi:omega-amidase